MKIPGKCETTVLLSQIGCVSVPLDILKKKLSGSPLLPDEQSQYATHSEVGAEILSRIPRMEEVTKSVRYQEKSFNGEGFPVDDLSGADIPVTARILRVLLDFDTFVESGASETEALAHLVKQKKHYDPTILDALKSLLSENHELQIVSIPVVKLRLDMQIASDIYTKSGTLLISKGQNVTQTVKRHLLNYESNGQIESAVDVWQ